MTNTIDHADLTRLSPDQLRDQLASVRDALDAEPDVITTSDGARTVGTRVLELLDHEQRLTAELHRRERQNGRGWSTTRL